MAPFAISYERLQTLQADLGVPKEQEIEREIALLPDRFDALSTTPPAFATLPPFYNDPTADRSTSTRYYSQFPGDPAHPTHIAFAQFFSLAAFSTMAILSIAPGSMSNWNPDEPVSYNNWRRYTQKGFIEVDRDHWIFNRVIHPAVGAGTYLVYRPAGDLEDTLRNGLLPAAAYMVFTYAVAWEMIEAAAEKPSSGDVLANMSGILIAEAAWQASRNGLLHVTF